MIPFFCVGAGGGWCKGQRWWCGVFFFPGEKVSRGVGGVRERGGAAPWCLAHPPTHTLPKRTRSPSSASKIKKEAKTQRRCGGVGGGTTRAGGPERARNKRVTKTPSAPAWRWHTKPAGSPHTPPPPRGKRRLFFWGGWGRGGEPNRGGLFFFFFFWVPLVWRFPPRPSPHTLTQRNAHAGDEKKGGGGRDSRGGKGGPAQEGEGGNQKIWVFLNRGGPHKRRSRRGIGGVVYAKRG